MPELKSQLASFDVSAEIEIDTLAHCFESNHFLHVLNMFEKVGISVLIAVI